MTLPDVLTEQQGGHNTSNSCASTHWLHYMSRRMERKKESSCLLPSRVLCCKALGIASCSLGGPLSGVAPSGVLWTFKGTASSLTKRFQSLFTCIIRIIILGEIIKFHTAQYKIFERAEDRHFPFPLQKMAIWLANLLNKTEGFFKTRRWHTVDSLVMFTSSWVWNWHLLYIRDTFWHCARTCVSKHGSSTWILFSWFCTLLCCVHPARWMPAGK